MDRGQSSNPQLFHCPTCGASLPAPNAPSVRCEYCGSNVLVPAEYRTLQKPEPVSISPQVMVHVSSASSESPVSSGRGPLAGIIIFIVIASIVCVTIAGILSAAGVLTTGMFFGNAIQEASTQVAVSLPTAVVKGLIEAPSPTPVPPLSVELIFGGEGTGAGKFDDPRYIAIDPDGNIFVADYQDGRIQKFDPNGKFLQLIAVQPDRNEYTLVRDMAADYRGRLLVARGGDVLIYTASDGTLTDSISGQFPDLNHDKVVVDLVNNLYAMNPTSGADAMVKYDPQGNVLWSNGNLIEGIVQRNKPSNIDVVNVDGLGNIFLLNNIGHEIYKFDTNGNFVDRFGSEGEEPQQFDSPGPMNVDSEGRVFVLDHGEGGYILKVFDNNGSYLKSIPWPDEVTYPRMFIFDLNGKLYTVTNTSQVARMSFLPSVFGD
jgi:sugar lactone lactonase YvrE/DNA-directed RNA polymerase subunit RPC12/RpoP